MATKLHVAPAPCDGRSPTDTSIPGVISTELDEYHKTCAVCLGNYINPHLIILCGHSFCCACIEGLPSPKCCPSCRAGPFGMQDVRPNYALKSSSESTVVQIGPVSETPSKETAFASNTVSVEERAISWSKAGNLPYGLALQLARDDGDIVLRIFLLDNSGSTAGCDGHMLQYDDCSGQYSSVPSTRWEEIKSTALDQAHWNTKLGSRCEFVLLNPPCPSDPQDGRDYMLIDPSIGPAEVKRRIVALQELLDANGPRGVTPLSQRIFELRRRLQGQIGRGQKVILSVITDGMPTSPTDSRCTQEDQNELVNQLRQFAIAFNSFIVIRLATDDDNVVGFYNQIDEELELPLDILDDLQGEGKEVHEAGNAWLAYTPLIHRIREGGTNIKLFDLLDERPFTPVEISMFMDFLFRQQSDAPFPRTPKELLQAVQNALKSSPLVFDGVSGRMSLPVDIKKLRKSLRLNNFMDNLSSYCSLM
eukprot:TRINITY_DN31042_c0_g1_i1.p1 TRINITY_DN31042_c0_g1~~TRINITY_DN31042_c0_g1_i1.p1  ORF type:complete len:477 (+),score=80.54 TRINITY_DN31042_c0_g1_i1:90-1520(+)